MTMRPQLASPAAIAVLTRGELPMANPTRFAAWFEAAPETSMVMNFPAPSPSRTICCARSASTSSSARRKSLSNLSPAEATRACFALPVAQSSRVSLVEVSPSTVIELKARSLPSLSRDCSALAGIFASVKT